MLPLNRNVAWVMVPRRRKASFGGLEMMKEGNEIMRKVIGVAMLFVTAATIIMTR